MADQGIEREAEKRRQTMRAMFRWGLSQDIVEIDPTAGLNGYDPGTARDRVLSETEIKAFWIWLDEGNLPPDPADVLRLQLLLGCRCGESSGLCAEEIDQQKWLWTLPAARSKNKKPRVTPLVGMARTIIESRISTTSSGPFFTTERGTPLGTSHVGHHLKRRRNKLPINDFCTHDLRRSTISLMAEMGFALDLVAAVVGHDAGSRDTRTLVRHYLRTDFFERKVAALRAWDQRMREIIGGRNWGSNVTSLRIPNSGVHAETSQEIRPEQLPSK